MAISEQHSMPDRLGERVRRAADAALADHSYVSVLDVFCGLGWMAPCNVESWRMGRVEFLDQFLPNSPGKISKAVAALGEWAAEKGLKPEQASYVRRSRSGDAELRFTCDGAVEIEQLWRTHYLSPSLPETKRKRLKEKLEKPAKPVVFQVIRDSRCSECGAGIEEGSFLLMEANEPLCLGCARMDDLEFLPAGDTALTRRAGANSERTAVVMRFSRSRGHYERQGILVELAALEKAERDCVRDAAQRAAARERDAIRRQEEDAALMALMAQEMARLFPGCPPREVEAIARHTAKRGSGRVGRSEAGRHLEESALRLAVVAAVRHRHTGYDELLAQGTDRATARQLVAERIEEILLRWQRG